MTAATKGQTGGGPRETSSPRRDRATRAPQETATTSLMGARSLVDAGVIAVLTMVASLGFAPAYGSGWFLLAVAGGLIVGIGSSLIGARLGLTRVNTLLVAIASYFLFGTAFALPQSDLGGVLPTLATLADLARAPVFAWRDAVTLSTPLLEPGHLAALPYFAAAACSLVSMMLLLWVAPARPRAVWPPSVALLGPLAVLASAIFIGTDDSVAGVLRGGAFAAVALVWLSWRRGFGNVASKDARRALFRSRALGTGVLVLVAALLTTAGGFVAAATVADQRVVAREQITPPFDPLSHTSPLAGFREYSKLNPDAVLFDATGLQGGDRIRLATLESYSGKSWQIADPQQSLEAAGSYTLSGRVVPSNPFVTASSQRHLDVTIRDYSDIWLPSVGVPTDVNLTGGSLPERSGDFRFNARASGGLVTSGLREGDTYEIAALVQDLPIEGQLDNADVVDLAYPEMPAAPTALVERLQSYVAGETSPYLQLKAIENALMAEGYFSHGTASDTVPSRAGHGLDRMQELFELRYLVGDEEQYASAMAIMARQLGFPARVVMGYAPEQVTSDGTTEVRGSDVTAWVEVPFERFGWVAFDPTPERTDVPVNTTTDPQSKPKAQVRQPPQTQEKPDELLTSADERRQEEEPDDEEALPGWILTLGVSLAVPLALFFVPLLVIGILKRRRRRKRQHEGPPHLRAAGAWSDSIDRFAELGYAVPPRSTRVQTAAAVHPSLASIADRSDRAVFGDELPTDEQLALLWADADASVAEARKTVGFWRRLRGRFAFRRRPRAVSWPRGTFGVHRGTAGNDRPGGEHV
ncbi:transglutaminase domain-containing protein [Pseudoclavibacter sp. JSM 162008]|uniref:transglutaminase domain-containing protein n=1 Tax=Pseudoclavibacter sp. JSM 162008 TaxID=3229855 RepID=UPI003525AD7C